MDNESILLIGKFLMSLTIGIVVGTERQLTNEFSKKNIGMRDFTLFSIIAFMASYFNSYNNLIWPICLMFILGLSLFGIIKSSAKHENEITGLTTNLSIPIVFLLSSLSYFNTDIWLISLMVFSVLIILELKQQWNSFVKGINIQEIYDFSTFLLIAGVITPLVPKTAKIEFTLYDTLISISVAGLWKIIMFVSLMTFVSYFIKKYIKGKNALFLSTFLGGLISSLATIWLFLKNFNLDKKNNTNNTNIIMFAYLAASSGSIFKDIVLVYTITPEKFLPYISLPLAGIFLLFFIWAIIIFSKIEITEEIKDPEARAMPIGSIFKFCAIFIPTTITMITLTSILTKVFGDIGNYINIFLSFISGMVSSATGITSVGNLLSSAESISYSIAGFSILLTMVGSVIAKYFLISKKIGFVKSINFFYPVVLMFLIGTLTLLISK